MLLNSERHNEIFQVFYSDFVHSERSLLAKVLYLEGNAGLM